MKSHILICFSLLVLSKYSEAKFPQVTIKPLRPNGFIVKIPDEPGIRFFGFHANINEEMSINKVGQISEEVRSSNNGYWEIKVNDIELRRGDVIYYWVFVKKSHFGLSLDDQEFTVKEFFDA